MSALSHVRLRFWDSECYTEAQALEFRRLRQLYTTYLAPVFGQEPPVMLRLRKEGDEYYPAFTGQKSPTALARAGCDLQLAQPLKPFANTLVAILQVYEQQRQLRYFAKGHANDPAHLLLHYLTSLFNEWMTSAACEEATLKRIMALQAFLDALRRENIFSQEPEGQGSMRVLLHNLVRSLTRVQEHLRYVIGLQSAREHFSTLQASVNQALDNAVQYLFYAVAEKSRSGMVFSLLSASADVVDARVEAALKTREGALLKNLIQHPQLVSALFPEGNVRVKKFGEPLCLVSECDAMAFIDANGQASEVWLSFLQQDPILEEQLDPAIKRLPLGICPSLLSESKAQAIADPTAPNTVALFIRLHGLIVNLAKYQDYLLQCWHLAGFGGDQLVYDRLAETITSFLTEFSVFNKALQDALALFQKHLDGHDTQNLSKSSHRAWRSNYEQASACQKALLNALEKCDETLSKVITHVQDASARCRRFEAALEACKRLQGAKEFLNDVRKQIGLLPRASYPGLDSQNKKQNAQELIALPMQDQVKAIDQVLFVLIPDKPQEAALLNQLCSSTPKTSPFSLFRGSYRRFCYLQDTKRLLKIGEEFARLQHYPERAVSNAAKPLVDSLRAQMLSELTRLTRLSEDLYWPFHRASQNFFASWRQVFQEALGQLDRIDALRKAREQQEQAAEAKQSPEGILSSCLSTADLNRRLTMAVPSLEEEDPTSEEDYLLKRANDALAKARALFTETLAEKSKQEAPHRFQLESSSPLLAMPLTSPSEAHEASSAITDSQLENKHD